MLFMQKVTCNFQDNVAMLCTISAVMSEKGPRYFVSLKINVPVESI